MRPLPVNVNSDCLLATHCTGLTLNGNTIHFTYRQFGTTGSLIENDNFIGDGTQMTPGTGFRLFVVGLYRAHQ